MRALALVIGALAVVTGAQAATQVHYVMGAFLRVTVDDDVPARALDACFSDARALDRTFSRYDAGSELTRLNAAGGGPAGPSMRSGLASALELERTTDGAFDVSVGALTRLWRRPSRPDADEIATARATVGAVALTPDGVRLGRGTELDFDGFAKGLAVDACVAHLRAAGARRALVSFGESSIYALGAPRDAMAWTFDVRGPDPETVVARLRLRDQAASVSAVYGGEGKRSRNAVGHIVDPRSGRPLAQDVVGVVVAPSAASAEALSKAVLVWGLGGLARVERLGGVRAARLTRSGVACGREMQRARALVAFDHPRSLDVVQAALR
ncbi:MAG TPA: FAD:protein FMN transferase [Candidatus Eisenbacteria bacterium]|nr:FAD:protein FMN transferase [Candidatus Eisenbacteria bacterium]